jgi:hypothetical protein
MRVLVNPSCRAPESANFSKTDWNARALSSFREPIINASLFFYSPQSLLGSRETARCRRLGSRFPLANQQRQLRYSAGFSWKEERSRILLSERLHSRVYSRGLQLPGLIRGFQGSRSRGYWNKLRQPRLSSRFRSTTPLAIHIAQRRGRFGKEGLRGQEVTRSVCRPSKFCNRQERNHPTHLLIPNESHRARRRGLKRPQVLELAYLSSEATK